MAVDPEPPIAARQTASVGVDLTIHELLVAMRLSASLTETPDTAIALIVLNMLDVATAAISQYAPLAPTPVASESAIRYCSWMFEVSPADQQRRMVSPNGFVLSGARAMLSSWHTPIPQVVK